jgi:hypothetical protein
VPVAPGREPTRLDQLRAGLELFHESFDSFTATLVMQLADGKDVFTRLSRRERTQVIEVFRIDPFSKGELIETGYTYDLPSVLARLPRAR